MTVAHEIITYEDKEIPIKWIQHGKNHSTIEIPPHWHSSLEIFYMRSGKNHEITIDGHKYVTYPNMVLLVNSAEVHSILPKYDEGLEAVTFLISYELLSRLLPTYTNKRFIREPFKDYDSKCEKQKRLSNCLESLYFAVSSEAGDLKKLQILKETYRLVYLLAKDWMIDSEVADFGYKMPGKGVRLYEIVSYIEGHYQGHYQEELSTQSIAETFNVSVSFLQKLFRQHLDTSLMAFVNSIRVQNAYYLLMHSDLPISTIAIRTGFTSDKAFRVAFKKRFNEPPLNYRFKKIK